MLILWAPVIGQSPLLPEDQAYVDSLWRAYGNNRNVAAQVKTLMRLDDFWYYENHDSSDAINIRVLELLETNLDNKHLSDDDLDYLQWAYSRVPINYGLVKHYQGMYKEALELQDSGYARSKRINDDEGVAMSLNNSGLIYMDQGNYERAINSFSRALEIAERIDNKQGKAVLNSVIGDVYLEQKDYNKALEHYMISHEISIKSGDQFAVSQILNSIGVVHMKLLNLKLALEYFDKKSIADSLAGNQQGKGTVSDNVGQIYTILGDSSARAGDQELAREFYKKAWAEFEIAVEQREAMQYYYGLSMSYINLSKLCISMELRDEAIRFARLGMDIAKKNGQAMEIRDAANILYEAYRQGGNMKEALSMMELYVEMRDSINSEDNTRAILRQQFRYSYEKQAAADSVKAAEAAKIKDAQIAKQDALAEKQDAELENKRSQQYALFGGLGLVGVFALFIFNRFRVTRKQRDIIEVQKNEVEVQKNAAEHQKELVEEKNKEILDSINYAKRLQEAILPPNRLIKEWLPQSFILYKPKDIVAGDFYWMESCAGAPDSEGNPTQWIYFAAADCTGHGVPGAMVSVVCSNALSKALIEEKKTCPAEILDRTRELVIDRFGRSEEEIKDGMDVALCALNWQTGELQYAGANNPLWIIRKTVSAETGESFVLEEVKADKQPIGKYGEEKPFTNHSIKLNKGDSLYIFSDGYPDQFGGEKGKKYKSGKLKRFFLSIQDKDMLTQRQLMSEEFENWRGDIEQIDDVCVIGVKI